jgi:alpha-tubulin suppressor-like RCC1 family protein
MRRTSIVGAAAVCLVLCSGMQAALWVTAIAAGGEHSLALASDGTVWVLDTIPLQVRGLEGVVAIGAGYNRDLALRADGTVWEWGNALTPVQVKDLVGVVAVSAGAINSLALTSDGTVWCWGWWCQPGQPSNFFQSTPSQVDGLTGIIAIAAGQAHCLALKSDGTVWAWGHNGYGQLGDGTIGPVGLSPTTALVQAKGLTGVTAIAAGYAHSLALKDDGTVWSWGVDGTVAAYRTTPEKVSELAGAVAIAAGSYTSVAVRSDGTVSEWGLFGWADGTPVSQPTQVPVTGLSGVQTVSVATSGAARLALKDDGTVWEWGAFRAVDAVRFSRAIPEQVSGISGSKAVAAGGPGGLALMGDGTLYEWSDPGKPVQVSGISDVVAIAMGSNQNSPLNTVLKGDGTVWEWTGGSAPVQVADLTGVVAIAAGDTLRLAVKGDGTVWEWIGQSTPTQVSGLSGAVAVSIGLEWSFDDASTLCAVLKSDGTVWAAPGYSACRGGWTPVQVSGLTGIVAIAVAETIVALKEDGTVWEWTWESDGTANPVQVSGLTGIVAVAAGSGQALSGFSSASHRLALKDDGTVWAWGDNRFGQLGDGTTAYRASPVQVAGLRDVAGIAAAAVNVQFGTLPVSLAVKRDGTIWAWGFHGFGRLDRSKPIQVVQPGSETPPMDHQRLGALHQLHPISSIRFGLIQQPVRSRQ